MQQSLLESGIQKAIFMSLTILMTDKMGIREERKKMNKQKQMFEQFCVFKCMYC